MLNVFTTEMIGLHMSRLSRRLPQYSPLYALDRLRTTINYCNILAVAAPFQAINEHVSVQYSILYVTV